MQVELLEATDDPEKLVCRSARNDYMEEYGAEMSFGAVMDGIEPADDVPQTVWNNQPVATKDTTARMCTLIGHLMDHGHFGPFEHPQATFHVKGISRSLMAQITRHRHASFDIQSMRYVSFDDADPSPGEAVVTIPEFETRNPAGRNAETDARYDKYDDDELIDARKTQYEAALKQSFKSYNNLLEMGVAPENARMVLPIGTKVNMVFSVNARMLMHIADMRAAADAQWEIREMTEEVLDLAQDWMPITFNYYNENLKNRKNRLAP